VIQSEIIPCYLVCTFWLSCIRFEGTQTTFVNGEKMGEKIQKLNGPHPPCNKPFLCHVTPALPRFACCLPHFHGETRSPHAMLYWNVSPGSTTQVKVALICATPHEPYGSAMMSLKPEYTIGDLLECNPTS